MFVGWAFPMSVCMCVFCRALLALYTKVGDEITMRETGGGR